MSKIDFNDLKTQVQLLKKHTPKKAIKFYGIVLKLEKKINKELDQSFLSKLFTNSPQASHQELSKRVKDLESVQTKIRNTNDESERIENSINDFLEELNNLELSNCKHLSEFKDIHQEYCENKKTELTKIINNITGTVEIKGAESSLLRTNDELKRRQNSVRLLDRVNLFYSEYEGAEEILDLYDLFSNFEEDSFKSDTVDIELQGIDNSIDALKKTYEERYPSISINTSDDSLKEIDGWLKELPDSPEKKTLNRRRKELTSEFNMLSNNRFSGDSTDKLEDLDRRASLLEESVLDLIKEYQVKKLEGIEPLFDELRNYFPDLKHIQESFSSLTIELGVAGKLHKWKKEYARLYEDFDKFVNGKLADLIRIKDQHLEESKRKIQDIENGPCSKEVSSNVHLLKQRITKLEQVGRTAKKEEIVSALIEIKKISEKISSLKEKADEDRQDYQASIDKLKEKAILLDTTIDRSGLNFETTFNTITDSINKINVNSDITLAVEELKKIDENLQKTEISFHDKCNSKLHQHKEHIESIHSIFTELSISFNIPEDNNSNITEQLQLFNDYSKEIDKVLNEKLVDFEEKRVSIVNEINVVKKSKSISIYDKDILNQLISAINAWEPNQDDLGDSLISLQTLIVDAEHKIARYAQEEIRAKSRINQLKTRINNFNKDYDVKYFPEVRKKLNGMIFGAEYATEHWKEVNQQLEAADIILNNLEKEARRIMIFEFNKQKSFLYRYLKINATSKAHNQSYDDAIKMKNEIESYRTKLPSRLSRMRLDSLLIRLV